MLKDSKMLSWKKAEKEALLHSQLLTEFRGQAFRKYAFLDKKAEKTANSGEERSQPGCGHSSNEFVFSLRLACWFESF